MKAEDVKRIYDEMQKFENKEVLVNGWVKSVRASKDFGFIDFSDGTCFRSAQIVFNKLDNFEQVAKLNAGSTIICKGLNPRSIIMLISSRVTFWDDTILA